MTSNVLMAFVNPTVIVTTIAAKVWFANVDDVSPVQMMRTVM